MKHIPLTQGKFALVDDEDFEWLNQWKWQYSGNYAIRSHYLGKRRYRTVYMHIEIMNPPTGMEVDHIQTGFADYGLNNQKKNLRICTNSQNRKNRMKTRKNTSGYKGVSWYSKNKKWRASIGYNKKSIFLGYFDNPIDAAKTYDEKSNQLFGEFSNPNFPS